MLASHLGEQLLAVHARHVHVGDYDVVVLLVQPPQRIAAVGCTVVDRRPVADRHRPGETGEQRRFVVDEQHPRPAVAHAASRVRGSEPAIGRRSLNDVPPPGFPATAIVPPCSPTTTA